MTESEWLAATDPGPMLEFLRGKASDRKLLLLSVSCCRRWPPPVEADRIEMERVVELTEREADGELTAEEATKLVKSPGYAYGTAEWATGATRE